METNSLSYRIYYTDGSTWDSTQGEPEDAPRYGVQVIVQKHPDPQERPFLTWQGDYYIWKKNQWFPVDRFAFDMYYFVQNGEVGLAGEYTDNDNWKALMDRAMKDPDFF